MADETQFDPSNPEWVERALEAPSTARDVLADGVKVHYEAWGEPGRPGMVLLHGSNAHLEWWRWVAPFLADQFHVVAIDSTGNGDSDWRDTYTAQAFADEIKAVVDDAQMQPGWFLVGHSFGGWVALQAAARFDQQMGGVIFMDYTVAPRERYNEWGMRAEREGVQPKRKLRVYEELDAAVARFRFLPEQPSRYPKVLEHLARNSLKAVDGGWTWKFDPTLFDYLEMGADQEDLFLGLRCPAGVILAERSDDEGAQDAEHMLSITAGSLPIIVVPSTHHHLMFEEPLAVVTAIKGLVLSWQQRAAG